jgi:hypothetical protein
MGPLLDELMFIVQGEPREPEATIKVTKATREEVLIVASELLKDGMPFVAIVADGCVYTVEEFATTITKVTTSRLLLPKSKAGAERPSWRAEFMASFR